MTDSKTKVPLAGLGEIRNLLVTIGDRSAAEIAFRDDFPQPVADLAEGTVWLLADVEAWLKEHTDVLADALKVAVTEV
jgi:hypothetical protein